MADFNVDIRFSRKAFELNTQFTLNKSQITVILGASGSGKSTLLRLLAGLEEPTKGKITYLGDSWFNSQENINLKAQQRSVGFVFQDYALFENMTVSQNIGFGLSKKQRTKTVDELLLKLDLVSHKNKFPAQLSGGQKQRVALGRALAIKPKLLLFDEPLSAIDHNLRRELQRELKKYIKEVDCPVVFVTHDLAEARFMADHMIVMSEGKTLRQGLSEIVLNNPVNKQTAKMLGWQNIIPILSANKELVETKWGGFVYSTAFLPKADYIAIRPEKIRFGKPCLNSLNVTITEINDFGIYKEFLCKIDDDLSLLVHRPVDEPSFPVNSKATVHLSSQHIALINNTENIPACFDSKIEHSYSKSSQRSASI